MQFSVISAAYFIIYYKEVKGRKMGGDEGQIEGEESGKGEREEKRYNFIGRWVTTYEIFQSINSSISPVMMIHLIDMYKCHRCTCTLYRTEPMPANMLQLIIIKIISNFTYFR